MGTPPSKDGTKDSKGNEVSARQQKITEGYGAAYHRRYAIEFAADREAALQLMANLQANINHFSPQVIAKFEKLEGDDLKLKVGDKFQIHITGPWNGPVRVAEVTPEEFTLVTLDGHLEAGEIHFRVKPSSAGHYRFEIESLARSRDRFVDFVYDKLGLAKLAQTEMWKAFCVAVAEEAGSREEQRSENEKASQSDVKVYTERRNEETGEWEREG